MSKQNNTWIAVGNYVESVDDNTPDIEIIFSSEWTSEQRQKFAERIAAILSEAGVQA